MSDKKPETIIAALELEPHPEGGYYRETYRSSERVCRENNSWRAAGTGIYFLLPDEICTNWHRVKSDELWHFYKGDELILEIIDRDGSFQQFRLGDAITDQTDLQALVPANCWQRAYSTGLYSLAGCTVSPGFEFEDFEMMETELLAKKYRQIADKINYNPFS